MDGLNADTGAPVGRVKGQRKDSATGAFNPSVFDPRDDESLVLCDGVSIQKLRARDAMATDLLAAPKGIRFVACAVGRNGALLVIERPIAARENFGTSEDALVLRNAKGAEVRRFVAAKPPFQVNRLGDRFLVTDEEGFILLDDDLRELARIPFVDDDNFASTLPLPSGREWIAVGGHSQWDHYGDAALAPPGGNGFEAPALKKPAKKNPVKKTKKPVKKRAKKTSG